MCVLRSLCCTGCDNGERTVFTDDGEPCIVEAGDDDMGVEPTGTVIFPFALPRLPDDPPRDADEVAPGILTAALPLDTGRVGDC